MYLDRLSHFTIKKVKTIYSANARSQHERVEYLITNYNVKDLPRMDHGYEQQTINQFLEDKNKKGVEKK